MANPSQNDRTAFLESLQLLVDRLKQPKISLSVLLEDLYQNPSVIRFADRKAFMLGNRLVRSYSKEIVSYNITPEDVLLPNAGIDQKITRYAAWKIDKNQDKFFGKIGTIHRRRLEVFSQLTNSLHESDLINQLKESADSAKKQLTAKTSV